MRDLFERVAEKPHAFEISMNVGPKVARNYAGHKQHAHEKSICPGQRGESLSKQDGAFLKVFPGFAGLTEKVKGKAMTDELP